MEAVAQPPITLRLTPRPYQYEAVAALLAATARGAQRPLLVLPTGTGKTMVFALLVQQRRGRSLILAHRDELIQQAVDKLHLVDPTLPLGVVQAERDEHTAPTVVASVQTVSRRTRLARQVPDFQTIIIDEAHHAPAPTYHRMLEYCRAWRADGPLVVGVTATPERGDHHPSGHPTSSIQGPAAHATAPHCVHTGDQPRHMQAALESNTSSKARQQAPGQIANEQWLTARQSTTIRERQLAYFQYTPHCSRRRKTVMCRDVLRQSVTHPMEGSKCLQEEGVPPLDMECIRRFWYDGLPGAANHDRKGGVMSSPTHVEREHPVDVAVDPRLSRGVKAFLQMLNASGGPPLETLPPLEARAVLANAQAAVPVELSGIAESETTIHADGYTIPLHIVRPAGATGPRPVFLFLHGGGWVLGDYPTHKRMVRDLVVLSGVPGVFVNYTRTPEARYPQAVQEIYAATKWVAAHGEEIGVDGTTLAIVGNSVGGNMTAVTALKAKEQGGPAIKLQIMMWPIVDANFNTESYRQFGEQRFLTTSLMRWMYDLYTTDPKERQAIYASPLQATVEQLQGLPPALIQVAESDILRDEGEAYGRKLDAAGVTVTTVRYDGMIHDFGLLNGLAEEPAVRSLFAHAAAELKHYLHEESGRRTLGV